MVRNRAFDQPRAFSGASRLAEGAIGHVDDLRFQDALTRDVDPDGKRRIPAGCSIYLRGWVAIPAPPRPAGDVFALIGGDLTFPTVYGDRRWDIAETYQKPELERVGFRAVYPLAGLPLGSYDIRVAAFAQDADEYHLLETNERFELVPSRYIFPGKRPASPDDIETKLDEIETTRGDRPRRGVLRVRRDETVVVRGWAVDREQSSASGGVFGVIDGEQYVVGVHGLPRHDVALALDMFGARRCGFTLRVPMRGLKRGRHKLEIIALGDDGASYSTTPAAKLLVTS